MSPKPTHDDENDIEIYQPFANKKKPSASLVRKSSLKKKTVPEDPRPLGSSEGHNKKKKEVKFDLDGSKGKDRVKKHDSSSSNESEGSRSSADSSVHDDKSACKDPDCEMCQGRAKKKKWHKNECF